VAKILVSGGGGYIGVPLCHRLKKNGHDVVALDRFFFEREPSVGIIRMDIRSVGVADLAGFDVVMDLAGLSNDASSEIDPRLTYEVNEAGGINLASAAKKAGVKRYIYSSSASVYGAGSGMFLTEESPINPLTLYAKSKVAVEDYLRGANSDDFSVSILRNSTVFGYAPRMRFDLAINVMAMRAMIDKRILIMGGGCQYRPFCHVEDIVDAFCLMLNLPTSQVGGQTYNVGDGSMNFTISQIAMAVKRVFRDAEIISVPDDADRRSYHLSFKKIGNLGFYANHDIENGIKEIERAILDGLVDPKDPRTITLGWYKSLIEWDHRIDSLKFNGRIL